MSLTGRAAAGVRHSTQMLSALRYPQYRRYWTGNLCAVSAQQIMWVAQGWLVYDLTGSELYLGITGLFAALPAIMLNLVGGVVADRFDQRRVIGLTQLVSVAVVGMLAVLDATGLVRVWQVFAVAFVMGAMQAFNNPARQSIFPQLIDRKDLMQAVALNSMVWQGTRIIAPATGGIVVSLAGTAPAFFLCCAGFLALAVSISGLKVEEQPRARRESMARDLGQGIEFIRGNFLFAFLIGMSFFSSFFGNAANQLMPVFARDILEIGPSGLGLLLSTSGIGSVVGVVIAGSLGDYERKGLLLIGGSSLYGLFLIVFGFSTYLPLSLATLFLMGMCIQLYTITLQTTLQSRVPDDLRGRVKGVYGMTYNVGPLGALQAGIIASTFGAPVAVALSGAAIMSFSLLVASSRAEVRRLQAATA
jgi:MFS family permease